MVSYHNSIICTTVDDGFSFINALEKTWKSEFKMNVDGRNFVPVLSIVDIISLTY